MTVSALAMVICYQSVGYELQVGYKGHRATFLYEYGVYVRLFTMSRNEDYRYGILKTGSTTIGTVYCFCQQGTHPSANKRVAEIKG
jgi:hypothetical protein